MTDGAIIKIPIESLSADALDGVIDDYVMREGTDYGHRDIDLEQKREAVRRQLASGRALITYDSNTHTTTIVVASR
ncbi:MAG: YheU family protein [Proteobacteria bacterium]|nr:YheU family protein [Pseudomonadota bacterium]